MATQDSGATDTRRLSRNLPNFTLADGSEVIPVADPQLLALIKEMDNANVPLFQNKDYINQWSLICARAPYSKKQLQDKEALDSPWMLWMVT